MGARLAARLAAWLVAVLRAADEMAGSLRTRVEDLAAGPLDHDAAGRPLRLAHFELERMMRLADYERGWERAWAAERARVLAGWELAAWLVSDRVAWLEAEEAPRSTARVLPFGDRAHWWRLP